MVKQHISIGKEIIFLENDKDIKKGTKGKIVYKWEGDFYDIKLRNKTIIPLIPKSFFKYNMENK